MMYQDYTSGIEKLERIASASRFKRLMCNPYKYIKAIGFRELIYKRTKEERVELCKTFFGKSMYVLLPSSTDIYLTGGKSHESEIRLAKYMLKNLKTGNVFIDIGAHYGYFSLLASELVGEQGKVLSFEASPKTYHILDRNTTAVSNMIAYNLAVSDIAEKMTFYEFPNLYSEYNSLDIKQFENEAWYKSHPPKEITIQSVRLEERLSSQSLNPNMIKIDVEGAEYKVLQGLGNFLGQSSPIIIMEFLHINRSNRGHIQAEALLHQYGYSSYHINPIGELVHISNSTEYLQSLDLDSDNIVFIKNTI